MAPIFKGIYGDGKDVRGAPGAKRDGEDSNDYSNALAQGFIITEKLKGELKECKDELNALKNTKSAPDPSTKPASGSSALGKGATLLAGLGLGLGAGYLAFNKKKSHGGQDDQDDQEEFEFGKRRRKSARRSRSRSRSRKSRKSRKLTRGSRSRPRGARKSTRRSRLH